MANNLILRSNPRKLNKKVVEETACSAGTVAALAATNVLMIPKLQFENAATYATIAELALAIAMSNKYPCASATAGGALLGALFQALAAGVSGDYSMIAWNPDMGRRLSGYANDEAYAGFPENLATALGA